MNNILRIWHIFFEIKGRNNDIMSSVHPNFRICSAKARTDLLLSTRWKA